MDSTRISDSLRIVYNIYHILKHQEAIDHANDNIITGVFLAIFLGLVFYVIKKLRKATQ